MKLKRFLVFGFNNYYPYGGLDDIIAAFESLTQALEYVRAHRMYEIQDQNGYAEPPRDQYQILDTMTLQEYNRDGKLVLARD